MKFMDLAMGQQFELDGEIYSRTGPLVASHAESGKQRFMARYMTVKAAGATANETPRKAELLSSDTVNAAFETLHGHYLNLLAQLEAELPPDRLHSIRSQLQLARQAFLDTLNQK